MERKLFFCKGICTHHQQQTAQAPLGTPIPLAWSKDSIGKVGAIEVYPAATLIAYGCRAIGYKKPVNVPERREIVDFLASLMKLPKHLERMEQNADTLDAVVCLLAAQDFLEGRGLPPTDQRLAEREGWIWIRSPIGTSHV